MATFWVIRWSVNGAAGTHRVDKEAGPQLQQSPETDPAPLEPSAASADHLEQPPLDMDGQADIHEHSGT